VLREAATGLAGAHEVLAPQITASLLAEVTGLVPDDGSQDRYITHLLERAPRVLEVIR